MMSLSQTDSSNRVIEVLLLKYDLVYKNSITTLNRIKASAKLVNTTQISK